MKRQFYVIVIFLIGTLPNAFTQNIPNDGIISDIFGGIQVGNLPEGDLNSDALIYGYSPKKFIKGYYIDNEGVKQEADLKVISDEWGFSILKFTNTNDPIEREKKLNTSIAQAVKVGADSMVKITYEFENKLKIKWVRFLSENANYMFFEDAFPKDFKYSIHKKSLLSDKK